MPDGEKVDTGPDPSETPAGRIDAANNLAWSLRHQEPQRAFELCQEALELSRTGDFSREPYLQGQATSLTTLAFLNQQMGRLDIALSQCFDAASLMESLPPTRATIDAWRITSWIYFFVGDIPSALDYGLKALRLARQLKLTEQEASVLDNLATVYAASDDLPNAAASQREVQRLARELGNRTLEAVALNNWANLLLNTGQLAEALEAGQKSLEITRELSYTQHAISVLDTVGAILDKMGQSDRAEQMLREGLELSVQTGSEMGQVYCRLGLGKVFLGRNDLNGAETHVEQALEHAVKIGAQPVQADCHLVLSDVFERKSQPDRALRHYKEYFATRERINSDASAKRLAVLKVTYQVETAKRDAEIYRLRNIELQREIQERTRAEAELFQLATSDPLTGAFNRRYFFELAQRELDRVLPSPSKTLSILMLDLDHFKAVNDTYGHAIGDYVLRMTANAIQKSLRARDIIGRYGGEEFTVALPETDLSHAILVAERIRLNIEKQKVEVTGGAVSVTASLGVSSLTDDDHRDSITLDALINRADLALLRAKEKRNQVVSQP